MPPTLFMRIPIAVRCVRLRSAGDREEVNYWASELGMDGWSVWEAVYK